MNAGTNFRIDLRQQRIHGLILPSEIKSGKIVKIQS